LQSRAGCIYTCRFALNLAGSKIACIFCVASSMRCTPCSGGEVRKLRFLLLHGYTVCTVAASVSTPWSAASTRACACVYPNLVSAAAYIISGYTRPAALSWGCSQSTIQLCRCQTERTSWLGDHAVADAASCSSAGERQAQVPPSCSRSDEGDSVPAERGQNASCPARAFSTREDRPMQSDYLDRVS
jgi:hypothetical protein